MYVQPYFPEPVVVKGNAASETYNVRLKFIRQMVGAHVASAVVVCLSALYLHPVASERLVVFSCFLLLLTLSITRQVAPQRRSDTLAVGLFFIPFLLLLGISLGYLSRFVAVWPVGAALICAALYTLFCGRDFSFVGLFAIAGVVSSTVSIFLAIGLRSGLTNVGTGCLFALLYLFYLVYDMCAILQRRQTTELLAATADLYRDLLNIFTYSIRVYKHWKSLRY